jgi:hypothetical protein
MESVRATVITTLDEHYDKPCFMIQCYMDNAYSLSFTADDKTVITQSLSRDHLRALRNSIDSIIDITFTE